MMPIDIYEPIQFEKLVSRILEANGFNVRQAEQDKKPIKADLVATLGDLKYLVEVKYYRTARAQVTLIESAAASLMAGIFDSQDYRGMLVLSCVLTADLRESLEEKFGLIIVDRSDLFSWAALTPELNDQLSALLEDRLPVQPNRRLKIQDFQVRKSRPDRRIEQDTTGTELCRELKRLKPGRQKWKSYEKLCGRILKYLFPNDLLGWHEQNRTDDGLNRFDYICRIIPGTDFWSFLVHHLNSRYILFEFKNHSEEVSQGQVLTTEKYLLEKGLRRVAIIFSRKGGNDSAKRMTQGAMRESGKLMLILDDEKICKMLHMKESGDDPTDLLFEVADDFLLSLPR